LQKNLNITELEYLNSTPPPRRRRRWSGVEENFYEGGVEKDYRNGQLILIDSYS
jgi:hypothetical protein